MKKHLDLHLVLDNSGTRKTPEVKAWLAKSRRFRLHFTPTNASWRNLVERFFAEITTKRIRCGAFASVAKLEEAIYDYRPWHNAAPNPSSDSERRALDALEAGAARYQTTWST